MTHKGRRSRLGLGVVPCATALLASLVGVEAWTTSAHAGDDPISHAADAARHVDFTGQIEVNWSDAQGDHRTTVAVTSDGGVMEVRGSTAILVGQQGRMVGNGRAWTLLWPRGVAASAGAPDVLEKYRLVDRPGPEIAGRPTNDLELLVGGRVRERLDVDLMTGLGLQRVVFNPDGTVVRSVRFDEINVHSANTVRPSLRVTHRALSVPAASHGLASPYEAPPELADGYRRQGVFRSPDGVHVVYSDGLDTLSVFEEPGSLVRRVVPSGATTVRVGRAPAMVWVWPGDQVAVWQAGPAVYTAVGDGPLSELVEAAASLPLPAPLSWSQRLRRTCRRMIASLTGQQPD